MSDQTPVVFVSSSHRRLRLSLSVACVGLLIGGSLVWGRSVEFLRDSESAPAVFFRTKPAIGLQPRPVSAPVRNFELVQFQPSDPEAGSGVTLLGIEELDQSAGYASLQPPIGTWTRKH